MKIKNFDISLSHINVQLDINNINDVNNIDRVLSLITENKDNQAKLIEILENTSLKFLKRLQDDGLIKDNGGPDVVPVYHPIVLDKAFDLVKAGGYSVIYNKLNKKKKSILTKILHWWWIYLIGVLIGLTLLAIENEWFK